jgi:Fe2+ transport system protein FeoA
MKYLKKIIELIYRYCHERWIKARFQKYKSFNNCHERWIKARFQKYKSFNNCLKYNGIAKLSDAAPGVYRFVAAYCDGKLVHRLLEMGFVPGEYLTVIKNTGPKGNIVIKIKGSKIALGNEIADKILLGK